MDRDQVNLIHYLYQGDPSSVLSEQQLYDNSVTEPLVWCGPDTLMPMDQQDLVIRDGDEVKPNPVVMGLVDAIEGQLRNLPRPDFMFGYPISAQIRHEGDPRPAFLAIPYRAEFDGVKNTVLTAAENCNFDCEVTGDLNDTGTVIDHVWQGIRRADVVVADISGANANVMIEVGMAAALGKEVILITQDEELPFDIRHWRSQTYLASDLPGLQADLEAAFGAVTARYPFEGPEPRF